MILILYYLIVLSLIYMIDMFIVLTADVWHWWLKLHHLFSQLSIRKKRFLLRARSFVSDGACYQDTTEHAQEQHHKIAMNHTMNLHFPSLFKLMSQSKSILCWYLEDINGWDCKKKRKKLHWCLPFIMTAYELKEPSRRAGLVSSPVPFRYCVSEQWSRTITGSLRTTSHASAISS